MKKIIIICFIFLNACSIIPYHKTGYILTKDNRKYELKNGHLWVNTYEIHTESVKKKKKDIKEIHLEY